MTTVLACRSSGAGSVVRIRRRASLKSFIHGAAFAILCLLAWPGSGFAAPPYYFRSKMMPPPSGMYMSTGGLSAAYANGVVLRNVAQREPSQSVMPPPTTKGANVTNTFTCTWEMEISSDGGQTFTPVTATAETTVRLEFAYSSGGDDVYSGETLSLAAQPLPWLMIRESPTLASLGQTTINYTGNGDMIDSFFDIYTEVSIDSGETWWPAADATRLRLKPDPALIPTVVSPRSVAPMPNGHYLSSAEPCQSFACGIALRRVSNRLFTGWQELPPLGDTQIQTYDSCLDFQFSSDGGLTWQAKRAPGTMTVSIQNVREFAGQFSYEAEVTQLDVAGGDLPSYIRIRESPTRASQGGATLAAAGGGGGGGGGYAVSSFFDVFTEISIDGGASWFPTTNILSRTLLERVAPAHPFDSEFQPTPSGQYSSDKPAFAVYTSGFVISNFLCGGFSQSIPPPAPGETTNHSFDAQIAMQVSWDGGLTFQSVSDPGALTVRTTGRLGGDGFTEYYDTEMLQLDINTGGPLYIMLRESPTRASLGRTTATALTGGGYAIDSFFDVYTEISTDGGASWSPTISGPGTVTLQPPAPLSITCPPNITVRAPTRAGAVVFYPPPAVSGGCPPVTVTCVPPSGSTFPLGVTPVTCVASDACENVAECSFFVTVLRPLHKHFFASSDLPPPPGMYVPPEAQMIAFSNGLLIRNPAHRLFTAGIPPPPPGDTVTHTFGSEAEVEVSTDGGNSWSPFMAPASTTVRITNNGPSGGDTLYDTEMLALTLSGGTLPPGVMVRESPTLESLGETRVENVDGGYRIDSFFDIYLEVSLDGGLTWSPAAQSCNVELKLDPALIAPVDSPRLLEPMPNGQYASPSESRMGYANGFMLREVRSKLSTQWEPYPPLNATTTTTFDAQLDFQVSTDGGLSWQVARAPATLATTSRNVRLFDGRSTFETTVTQLDAAGGDLPVGVMIRESPTLVSEGGISSVEEGGGYDISSFFDIFTEISTDGGGSWWPATNGPVRLNLERVAPTDEFLTDLQPPLTGRYFRTQPCFAFYPSGIVLSNVFIRRFTASVPPPPPGSTSSHTFGAQVEMAVSIDGGATWSHASSPATITVQTTGRLGGDGVTEYYDTEMLNLSIAGGSLPSLIQFRESPTRASLGRTTSTSVSGGYQIDSFFDIYTEVSTDGGLSWMATVIGPAEVLLERDVPLQITCPSDITVAATDWNGSIVSYPPPVTSGGVPPITVICTPPSGSLFPIGVTPVLCEAEDVVGQTDSCSFNVNVVKVTEFDTFFHSIGRLTLQNPAGGSETIWLAGSSSMETYIGPSGEADDTDSDGLDEAAADLTDYALRGYSPMLGAPVVFRHASGARNPGEHEETVNNTLGLLDIPPFAPTGTCTSFFDIFAEIKIGEQVLHPSASFRIQTQIHHKPPAPGEKYVTPQQLSIPLLDETGKPTGYNLIAFEFVPVTTAEIDFFSPIDTFLVLSLPSGLSDSIRLTGMARTHVYFEGTEGVAKDNTFNGLEDVLQEMVELSLSGTCNEGPVSLSLASNPISLGQIEEQINNNLGLLDIPPFAASGTCFSFFDVFYRLSIGGSTYHNTTPWRLPGVITHKPCVPGDILAGMPETPLDMYDDDGEPTLVQLVKQWLALTPPDLDIDATPALSVQLSWPNPSTGYRLESCSNIVPPCLWLTVTNTPIVGESGRKEVELDASCSNQFFRLNHPLP